MILTLNICACAYIVAETYTPYANIVSRAYAAPRPARESRAAFPRAIRAFLCAETYIVTKTYTCHICAGTYIVFCTYTPALSARFICFQTYTAPKRPKYGISGRSALPERLYICAET